MKKLLIVLIGLLPSLSYSQTNNQKLSKDSIRFYRQQLSELSRATYDSMIRSDRYKVLLDKLQQNGKRIDDNFGVELCGFTGIQINNYESLNSRLSSLNIEKKRTLALPIGIGLAFRFNKFIVGYDMTPTLVGDNSSGAYIHGYVSTNIIRTKKWIFSPQLGYGGQSITTRIKTKSSASDFNSYFTTSANQVELRHSNSVLDFAIAFKFVPPKNNGYVPLFRMGYRHGIKSKEWEVKNGNSLNAPIDRNSNFYFQIMLGFGD